MLLSLRIHHFSWGILLLIGFSSISALPKPVEVPVQIPYCPVYSRVIRRPDGEARKCLPHQLNLCLNALDDQSLIDARGVCCYHNQVDYFCCMDIPTRLCESADSIRTKRFVKGPSYRNVTVVIHNNFPQSPFPVRSFHFRKGLTTEIENLSAARTLKKN
uniref:DB domain-containing protein n=1 Tax=Globodera pallida TaxID=36090 RepID=A0A183CJU7_GLOPA